jgi:hypothetical protein
MMNTATMMVKMAEQKGIVTGTYHGVPFRGWVASSRQLNWAPDYPEQVVVELYRPITVFGVKREHIRINSRDVDAGQMTIELS